MGYELFASRSDDSEGMGSIWHLAFYDVELEKLGLATFVSNCDVHNSLVREARSSELFATVEYTPILLHTCCFLS